MEILRFVITFVLVMFVTVIIYQLTTGIGQNPIAQLTQVALLALVTLILELIVSPPLSTWLSSLSRFIVKQLRKSRSLKLQTIVTPALPSELSNDLGAIKLLTPPSGPQLIVVTSGKGGVGKSLLSLGLVEHLSRQDKVLLIDFDFQNRGLTSLLGRASATYEPSVFVLLKKFRKMLEKEGVAIDKVFQEVLRSNSKLPEGFTQEHFNTMRDKFARVPETDVWEDLQKFEFAPLEFRHISSSDRDIPIVDDKVPLHPQNAFFLSSRLDNEPFLFSDESTSSFVTVYLFLRTFCYWLQTPNDKIQYVVLDCHGAHDMFTVGSLLAAQELITVTTLDAGSIHGTAELIESIKSMREQFSSESEAVLVINNLRDWDDPEAENAFGGKITGFEKVEIAEDNEIRDIMKEYEFGDISRHKRLWKSIGDICRIIKGSDGNPHGPQKLEPNIDLKDSEILSNSESPSENDQLPGQDGSQ